MYGMLNKELKLQGSVQALCVCCDIHNMILDLNITNGHNNELQPLSQENMGVFTLTADTLITGIPFADSWNTPQKSFTCLKTIVYRI